MAKAGRNLAKYLSAILCLFLIMTGCSVKENSDSLSGFCERMNILYESREFSPSGYGIDTKSSTFSRFYCINKYDLYIEFCYNGDKKLSSMTLTFNNESVNDDEFKKFIENCIISYSVNNEDVIKLLKENGITKYIKQKTLKTKKAELGNCQLLVDNTELGTVITVCRNNTP